MHGHRDIAYRAMSINYHNIAIQAKAFYSDPSIQGTLAARRASFDVLKEAGDVVEYVLNGSGT